MKSILYIFLAVFLMACTSSPATEEPERPGTDTPLPPDNPEPEPDYTAQISDATFRFTGLPGCEMRYDAGGVLFIADDQARISGHNLTSGRNFSFDSATGTLTADGIQIPLTSAEKVFESDTAVWYRLTSQRTSSDIWLVAPR